MKKQTFFKINTNRFMVLMGMFLLVCFITGSGCDRTTINCYKVTSDIWGTHNLHIDCNSNNVDITENSCSDYTLNFRGFKYGLIVSLIMGILIIKFGKKKLSLLGRIFL